MQCCIVVSRLYVSERVTFMYKVKKALCILLSFLMLFSFSAVSSAAGEPAEGESAAEENIPELKSLDTSAIDGKMYAYKGIESYFVIYPEPLEAESRFDVRNAKIECSEEGIVEVKPEKIEEYRFGSVLVTGLKLGKTTVTVTDPASGVSCSVEVTVLPAFPYKLQNFVMYLDYVPFYLFMWLVSLFAKKN